MSSTANNFSSWEYQVIALAGIAQSAALVHDLATRATMPESDATATINSLLVLNPKSVADVYPNVSHLSLGLQTVQSIFNNERVGKHADIVRYTLGMVILRNKLMANARMQEQLRAGLQQVAPITTLARDQQDAEFIEAIKLRSEQTFEQLARLYQDTISTLPYRIQVQGKMEHLKNDWIAWRIRALLLAGIRSAVLLHQLGGRRWHLIFYRKRIQDSAATIRRKLIVSV